MEKVSKIQIGCSKYDIQDSEARQLIQELSSDILRNIDVEANVDNITGTPSVQVIKGDNKLTLNFSGLKGESGNNGEDAVGIQGPKGDKGDKGDTGAQGPQGEPGYDGKTGKTPVIGATASYDYSVAGNQPHVHVDVDGEPEHPVFNFRFSGLRGLDGADGQDGRNGRDGIDGVDGAIAENTVREIETRITETILHELDELDDEIKDDVTEMVSQAEWWQENIPEGIVVGVSNFGDDNATEYFQQLGQWVTDDEGNIITSWSEIWQRINNIGIAVKQLTESPVNPQTGEIDYDTLVGKFYTYITDDTVNTGLRATWAHMLGLDGADDITVLEWLTSGVKSQANSKQATANLFAAARHYDETGKNLLSQAWSGVQALVERDPNDPNSWRATSWLASLVQSGGNLQTLAQVSTYADVRSAVVDMFANYQDSYGSTVANIFAIANASGSLIKLKADQIDLQGHIWADDINASSVVTLGLDALSGNKVSVTSNGIIVTNGSTATTTVMPGYINLGLSVAGTSYVSNGGLSIGRMQYSVDGNVLQVGSINTNGNLSVGGNLTTGKILDSTGGATITLDNTSGGLISLDANVVLCNSNHISSDETLKNIIGDVSPSVESIASTRTVDYEFKKHVGTTRSGAIAQDWQSVLPNSVTVIDTENHLGLDYSSAALISAVVDAREIVKLKQENEELKQRLAAIEERLANL